MFSDDAEKKINPNEIPSRKLTCPLKRDHFNRKTVFQPSFFRGHISFQATYAYFQQLGCTGFAKIGVAPGYVIFSRRYQMPWRKGSDVYSCMTHILILYCVFIYIYIHHFFVDFLIQLQKYPKTKTNCFQSHLETNGRQNETTYCT